MNTIPEPDHSPNGPTFEGRRLPRPHDELVDQGARFDMDTMLSRRRMLSIFGLGAGAMVAAACSSGTTTSPSTTSATAAAGEIPDETNGPYPADGTQDLNILTRSGIERSDIRSNLDGSSTVDGVPLTFTFEVTDMANDSKAFAGAAVYLWQCDAQGRYSMYSDGVENDTWLRGIQEVGDDGKATFKTIVPGCYTGRWTHLHFEVYPDLASATNVDNAIATSQVCFPKDMLDAIYQRSDYDGSAQALAQVGSPEKDNVFGDGYDLQMGTFDGEAASGYTGSLAVGVDTTTEPEMGAPPAGGGPGGGAPDGAGPGGPPPGMPGN